MTKLVSAPARRVRPALSDRTARKLTELAREIAPDTDPTIVENVTRRACRAAGFRYTDDALVAFRTYADLQREWDVRIDRVLSRDLSKAEPPDENRPTHLILNEASAALVAFLDSGEVAA